MLFFRPVDTAEVLRKGKSQVRAAGSHDLEVFETISKFVGQLKGTWGTRRRRETAAVNDWCVHITEMNKSADGGWHSWMNRRHDRQPVWDWYIESIHWGG